MMSEGGDHLPLGEAKTGFDAEGVVIVVVEVAVYVLA